MFYFSFGWLSLWLGPAALAWTGRLLTWLLLAWAWRRLSVAVVPRAWYSVLTAALFVCLMERCHMAGEWVIGGVEAKDFAYVFVFLGLEAIVRNRWNRGLLMFGAAAAFHVVVGGWAVVAAGVAWLWLVVRPPSAASPSPAPPLRSLWPGIWAACCWRCRACGPRSRLDWGVDPQTARQAHEIYVFERLPHHLVLAGIAAISSFVSPCWACCGCCWDSGKNVLGCLGSSKDQYFACGRLSPGRSPSPWPARQSTCSSTSAAVV